MDAPGDDRGHHNPTSACGVTLLCPPGAQHHNPGLTLLLLLQAPRQSHCQSAHAPVGRSLSVGLGAAGRRARTFPSERAAGQGAWRTPLKTHVSCLVWAVSSHPHPMISTGHGPIRNMGQGSQENVCPERTAGPPETQKLPQLF